MTAYDRLPRRNRADDPFSEITVSGHTSRPQTYAVRKHKDPSKPARTTDSFSDPELHDHSFEGFGLYWEADAVARCLSKGLKECPEMPWDETTMVMEVNLHFCNLQDVRFRSGPYHLIIDAPDIRPHPERRWL